jgi:hypothetical protein
MSRRLLAIGAGIAQGVNQASQNIMNLSLAKQKLERDREEMDLQRKKMDAETRLVDMKAQEFEWQKGEGERNLSNITRTLETIGAFNKGKQAATGETPDATSVDNDMAPIIGYNINPKGGISANIREPKQVSADEQIKMKVAKGIPLSESEQRYSDQFLANRGKSEQAKLFGVATDLRKEFIDRPEVKEYVNISTQVRSMDSLLNKALEGNMKNKVALDQALISMYNKLTDPSSVVRESEYARTPENLPILNRLTGAIKKIEEGGAGITDDDRKALVIGAKIIANERGKTYNEALKGYQDLSGKGGIDPEIVTRGMKAHEDLMLGEAAPAEGGEKANQAIADRIVQLRQSGMQDSDINAALQQKGIDPALYGVK